MFAGLPKLIFFRWEVESFTRFGPSPPAAWDIAAGLIEMVGGALLIARRRVVTSSLVLAATMAVAGRCVRRPASGAATSFRASRSRLPRAARASF